MLAHPHVLVADDDEELRNAVIAALKRRGAHVVGAASGGELIERMADDGPFDILVTDVSMPWMNGLQAMQAVRTAGLGIPIVVMTALEDERIPAQVRALGSNALLLHKPFELDELEKAVEKLLASEQQA